MSPLLIQPIRPIKPISFASSMQRAKEGDRAQDWRSQMARSQPDAEFDFIAPQYTNVANETSMVFPRFSTLALVQMLPPRSMPPARLQDYTAIASSNDSEVDVGIG